MSRLVRWTAGVVGIAALARLARRLRDGRTPGRHAPDPAAELRERLAEARDPAPDAPAAARDTTAEPLTDGEREPLDERRARVHSKAQEAIDAMRSEDA